MNFKFSVVGIVLLILSQSVHAEMPTGFFGPAFGKPVPSDTLKTYPVSMDTLEGEGLRAIEVDLNGDEKREFIRVYGPSLCGTGGCPYEIFDGATKKRIGELFGNPVWVFPKKINGWPVLTMYSHSSVDSGSYTTMVFDGKGYVNVSSVFLYQKAVDDLFEQYEAVPKID